MRHVNLTAKEISYLEENYIENLPGETLLSMEFRVSFMFQRDGGEIDASNFYRFVERLGKVAEQYE